MKKGFILLLSLCYIISSCGNLSEKEIEETTSTGVVLVQNQSYYEVVLSNGESLYFSGFDEEGDLTGITTDKDSVELVTFSLECLPISEIKFDLIMGMEVFVILFCSLQIYKDFAM